MPKVLILTTSSDDFKSSYVTACPLFGANRRNGPVPKHEGHDVTEELLNSSENVVRVRTFGKSSYPDNIFKSSYVTPCSLNEAMRIVFSTVPIWGAKPPL